MTRGHNNARTGVDRLEANGRLRKAKTFHPVAREALVLLDQQGLERMADSTKKITRQPRPCCTIASAWTCRMDGLTI